MLVNIKKYTYEDKFDRRWCCYTQRTGVMNKIKTENRRLFRKKLKRELEKEKGEE